MKSIIKYLLIVLGICFAIFVVLYIIGYIHEEKENNRMIEIFSGEYGTACKVKQVTSKTYTLKGSNLGEARIYAKDKNLSANIKFNTKKGWRSTENYSWNIYIQDETLEITMYSKITGEPLYWLAIDCGFQNE